MVDVVVGRQRRHHVNMPNTVGLSLGFQGIREAFLFSVFTLTTTTTTVITHTNVGSGATLQELSTLAEVGGGWGEVTELTQAAGTHFTASTGVQHHTSCTVRHITTC